MGCEQVCLKWNNFSLNITKNIDDLWKDESLVDVSIISDGQCIQAHKVILSASSPLFKSLFAVNPCQHPVIILQDVRFRELVSIITFIYKGEVNIFEESLPALLQAAKTLQIRGLSDSVDRDSLNRLYALRDEEPERTTKKRKTHNNNSSSSNNSCANTQTHDAPSIEDDSATNLPEKIIPKEEPKLDNFPADFLAHVSDDEDVKTEELVLHSDRTQDILQSADLVAAATTDDTSTIVNATAAQIYACPFCSLTYKNWGFRRRHIKSVHCKTGPEGLLTCRLCPASANAGTRALTLEQWIYHMLDDHQLDSLRVQEDVSVYKEAIMVLQSTSGTHAPADNVT